MILALLQPAFACGALFVADTGTAAAVTADLRTIYLMGDTRTTLITQVSWSGDASSFALVIPIPGLVVEDQVAAADAETLNQLINLTDPSFSGSSSCSMGLGVYGCAAEGGYQDTSAVAVLGDYTAGPYDVQLLDAESSGDITGWLRDAGYAVPDAAQPVLADYADRGFYFLAVQLREVPATATATALPAIAVTYEGTDVIYPMRLSATSSATELEVMVMTVGDHRMEPVEDGWVTPDLGGGQPIGDEVQAWYNTRLRTAIDAVGARAWGLEYADVADAGLPLFVSLEASGLSGPKAGAAGSPIVTRYRTWMSPEEMTGDLTFVPAERDESYSVSGTVFAGAPGLALLGVLWARRRGLKR